MSVVSPSGPLFIVGCGGHARVVLDAAVEAGWTVAGLIESVSAVSSIVSPAKYRSFTISARRG